MHILSTRVGRSVHKLLGAGYIKLLCSTARLITRNLNWLTICSGYRNMVTTTEWVILVT